MCGKPFCSRAPLLLRADTFIQKTKKLYLDTRTQRNVSKLNSEIAEVSRPLGGEEAVCMLVHVHRRFSFCV